MLKFFLTITFLFVFLIQHEAKATTTPGGHYYWTPSQKRRALSRDRRDVFKVLQSKIRTLNFLHLAPSSRDQDPWEVQIVRAEVQLWETVKLYKNAVKRERDYRGYYNAEYPPLLKTVIQKLKKVSKSVLSKRSNWIEAWDNKDSNNEIHSEILAKLRNNIRKYGVVLIREENESSCALLLGDKVNE